MSERSLTLDAGEDAIFAAGGESVLANYDLSSGHLPIAISADPDKEFNGWYDGENLMIASDLVNIQGNKTWTAQFIDIEPNSIHLNFSAGSTDGVTSVNFTNQALTIGGVGIIADTATNGFTIEGSHYSDPTISAQAAEACNAPICVSGTVDGYNVLGTFISTGMLDADETGQLETGEFFVALSAVAPPANTAKFTVGDTEGKLLYDGSVSDEVDITLSGKIRFPLFLTRTDPIAAWKDSTGTQVTNPSDVKAGETYTPVLKDTSSLDTAGFVASSVGPAGTVVNVGTTVWNGITLTSTGFYIDSVRYKAEYSAEPGNILMSYTQVPYFNGLTYSGGQTAVVPSNFLYYDGAPLVSGRSIRPQGSYTFYVPNNLL